MAEEATLWAVVVGAAIPTVGTLVTSVLTYWGQDRQWRRQQEVEAKEIEAERIKKLADKEEADREKAQEIYRKCILHLTYFDRKYPHSAVPLTQNQLDTEDIERLEDVENSLLLFEKRCIEIGLLKGNFRNTATSLGSFRSEVYGFLTDPLDGGSPGRLRSAVEELSLQDWALYSPPAR